MKQPIDKVINLLEKNGPFEGVFTCGGKRVLRIKPSDGRLVNITSWLMLRDGKTCPEGTDILVKRNTEFGFEKVLYVKFRKPNTHWLSEDQIIYRINLES